MATTVQQFATTYVMRPIGIIEVEALGRLLGSGWSFRIGNDCKKQNRIETICELIGEWKKKEDILIIWRLSVADRLFIISRWTFDWELEGEKMDLTRCVVDHLDNAFAVAADFTTVERPHANSHFDGRHFDLFAFPSLSLAGWLPTWL